MFTFYNFFKIFIIFFFFIRNFGIGFSKKLESKCFFFGFGSRNSMKQLIKLLQKLQWVNNQYFLWCYGQNLILIKNIIYKNRENGLNYFILQLCIYFPYLELVVILNYYPFIKKLEKINYF